MLQLLASAAASVGMMWGGLFGGHPAQMPPNGTDSSSTAIQKVGGFFEGLFGGDSSSTPPDGDHMGDMHGMPGMGTSSPMHMGSTSPMGMGPGDMRNGSTTGMNGMGGAHAPAVVGVVDSVSGTTLTVDGKSSMGAATSTYTVDASSAKIFDKGAKDATTANITAGNHVIVIGTISGSSVTAQAVLVGVLPPGEPSKGVMKPGPGHTAEPVQTN